MLFRPDAFIQLPKAFVDITNIEVNELTRALPSLPALPSPKRNYDLLK